MDETTPLYDAMCKAIEECHANCEAYLDSLGVEDLAQVARMAQNLEPERQARGIRIRAWQEQLRELGLLRAKKGKGSKKQ
jgi:hypothetical protein